MSDFITFKTSSPAGDLISFLAGIKQLWHQTGKKAVIYQRIGMIGSSYLGSVHPFETKDGEPVCMNEYMFDMLRPLIKSQPYIEDFRKYKGEDVIFDFDLIRQDRFTNQPNGSLNRWYSYVFPEMTSDLSKKWIEIPETISNLYSDKGIINFTQRHRNPIITYHFLKQYQHKLAFAGLQKERDLFCREWDLEIPLLQVDNFYELAKIISGSKFFLGCQSFCFQLAEATKTPRILECFPLNPNVIPIGEKAYDFYNQLAVQYYVYKLFNNEQQKS